MSEPLLKELGIDLNEVESWRERAKRTELNRALGYVIKRAKQYDINSARGVEYYTGEFYGDR